MRPPIYDSAEVTALEDAHLPALSNIELSDLPALLTKWRGGEKRLQGFVFGIELAMPDLMGRVLNVPVCALLGGAVAPDLPEYLSLSCEAPDEMSEIARRKGDGFRVIQAKLGDGDIDADLARVRAVLSAMHDDQQLLADFNGALKPDDAIHALSKLDDPRVMWEEPCSDYDDCVTVARTLSAPVCSTSASRICTHIRGRYRTAPPPLLQSNRIRLEG